MLDFFTTFSTKFLKVHPAYLNSPCFFAAGSHQHPAGLKPGIP
jgi:hypothetical protein